MQMPVAPSSHAGASGTISQAFARYDRDHSGTLTKDECFDFIKVKGLSVTRQYLEGVWTVFDENGDGTLDKKEFATLYEVLMKKSEARGRAIASTTQQPVAALATTTFESEIPPEALSYYGELARRSRAGEGSSEIIACSFVVLAVMMLVLAVLFGADQSPTDSDGDDVAGSSDEDPDSHNLWWVGVAMSCVACLANSFGYNFVRKAHTIVEERHAAGDKDFGVRDTWQFPVGWFCMVVLCAFLDTFALSFTDPALIAPLSGLTLVLNVWVAQLVNGEQVVPLDSAVTSLILTGVIVTITNGPSGAVPDIDADYLCESLDCEAYYCAGNMPCGAACSRACAVHTMCENCKGSHLFRPAFLFYEVVMHGSALLVHRYCVKPLYGDMTEEGIREGRLQNPQLNKFAPVILPWVGAVYTAHMNVSVAVCFSQRVVTWTQPFSQLSAGTDCYCI